MMRVADLVRQSLKYYWRTNLAVVFGVAIAVAILAGALIVGDSVRASLRDLFLQRLGKTDHVISGAEFFREQLAADIQAHPQFADDGFNASCPLIVLEGTVSHESSGHRATAVRVYGVDERFWKFNGAQNTPSLRNREVLVSESLTRELESHNGDALLLRIEKPSVIPVESLHGRKEDPGRTLRLTISQSLPANALGEFSVQPQQSAVRAVFVSLKSLQRELGEDGKANTVLVSETQSSGRASDSANTPTIALERILKDTATLDDYGIRVRSIESQKSISLERTSTFVDDSLAETSRNVASKLSLQTAPVLSYLANSIGFLGKAIPYSLVTAVDETTFEKLKAEDKTKFGGEHSPDSPSPIILNEWAARDLGAPRGGDISLDYYYWHEDGRLETKTARFYVAGIVPISGLAADRDLVPDYPGISESPNLSDWDPPFPVDLKLIRKQDEDYWDQYRTTPKAFIPLSRGQELWQSRFGKMTSIRLSSNDDTAFEKFSQALRTSLEPSQRGFNIVAARQQGLEASRGATDFGEYFLYFSFFLMISALLLASLFFKLGIEQRLREIGTLQAIGFSLAKIRRLFLTEAFFLALAGSLLGLLGAVAYGYLILLGLRTWWIDAVGTNLLTLHISPFSLALGAGGGVLAVVISIVWTLRRLGKTSARSLLSGAAMWEETRRGRGPSATESATDGSSHPRLGVAASRGVFTALPIAIALTVIGMGLLLAAFFRLIPEVAGFFGGGAALLIALLGYQSAWLRRPKRNQIQGSGWPAVSRLGFRNATHRPSRSVLCITLIALSTFIIVSVDAFRRGDSDNQDRKSGSGGYLLMAESLLPLVQDLNTPAGREALNLRSETSGVAAHASFTRFRLRPGDDVSCLNLYAPRNPRILGAPEDFISSNRFAFQSSLSQNKEEADNPWLLLNRELEEGVVPVIADANSISYVLHLGVGDEFVLTRNQGPVRLRIVGALADSVFQSEMVMSEKNFLRLFPDQEGQRYFLIDAPQGELSTISAMLEERLADFGFDVVSTRERLANFHRVENTYLSTFQMLGGLGLVLGTLGMAAVLLRNVFERRKELALLRAVGYNSTHFTLMVIAENALLLFLGLFTGAAGALLAIAPVFFERGGRLPNISLGFLLLAVLISGLAASLVATWAALRSPLLAALRAE